MDYFLSWLGMSKSAPDPPERSENAAAPRDVNCRGWSRPDPTIRLRVENDKRARIFGYPEPEDIPSSLSITGAGFGNGGEPFLYLCGTVPAYVDYIMGADWRSRLHDYHGPDTSTRRSQEWQVISRGDGSSIDEREHCLRMRRCGATGVRSEVDINNIDGEGSRLGPFPDYQQIFGWPAEGGVWILRNVVDYGPMSQRHMDDADLAAEDEI